ncbi:uroporphyrinogen-III C-methyltransferase [Caenimonas aquaedulcis]|uniref:Uroporphyrinogen-III C-methyltransferase n=1 Tax=Caenimonas aquaedulcis TaxID=2793270 RepID=A0A931MGJ9_9BURK|nr:uroporphyrinogen-III C-methyltransferase [Caenimonas aquaedulcis]
MSAEPADPANVSPVPTLEVAQPPRDGAANAGNANVVVVRGVMYFFLALSALALVASGLLWQKLSTIQEQLARQSADSGASALEARTLARQAQELARDTAARQALTETRLGEVALQRTQIEELMQSLSRSRDENLVVDIESALRLAQQQAQLTATVEPLLAELRNADKRLDRAAQPRLSRVRAAIARDIDRVRAASVTDVPSLLVKLDELARQVDELPMANAVAPAGPASAANKAAVPAALPWWERLLADVRDEARNLVRVSRVDQPEAALLAPEQAFFLRENLKLKLLNARLALLARQTDSARADVAASTAALRKYFDPSARKTQVAIALAQQVQAQLRTVELPRIDETLAVLATAAAGR